MFFQPGGQLLAANVRVWDPFEQNMVFGALLCVGNFTEPVGIFGGEGTVIVVWTGCDSPISFAR